MLVKSVIFTMQPIGSLEVYILQTAEEAAAGSPSHKGFYWQDAASPQGYGPFNFISSAIEHYKWVVQQAKKEVKINPIIRVDFQSKKRVADV